MKNQNDPLQLPLKIQELFDSDYKVGYVFPIVSILPQVEFGRNDHRENAPYFIRFCLVRNQKVKTCVNNPSYNMEQQKLIRN